MSLRWMCLAPILLPQALWVAARATRLPEAAGPRQGRCGHGPPVRLLILGDSSAAGVGVAHQDEALGGQVAEALAQAHRVEWQVVARSGATVTQALHMVAALPEQAVDYVVIALGVNDAKNGVPRGAWRRRYEGLLDLIDSRFGGPRVCLSGVPPLGAFPLLPWPLRSFLGERSAAFDADLRALAARRLRAVHMPMDFPLDRHHMAPDGFHPGAAIYRAWGARAAACLVSDINSSRRSR